MAIKRSDLYSSLWVSCNELRGGIASKVDSNWIYSRLYVMPRNI